MANVVAMGAAVRASDCARQQTEPTQWAFDALIQFCAQRQQHRHSTNSKQHACVHKLNKLLYLSSAFMSGYERAKGAIGWCASYNNAIRARYISERFGLKKTQIRVDAS
jgi:hypothetical protein